jgi:hypothetical protein
MLSYEIPYCQSLVFRRCCRRFVVKHAVTYRISKCNRGTIVLSGMLDIFVDTSRARRVARSASQFLAAIMGIPTIPARASLAQFGLGLPSPREKEAQNQHMLSQIGR